MKLLHIALCVSFLFLGFIGCQHQEDVNKKSGPALESQGETKVITNNANYITSDYQLQAELTDFSGNKVTLTSIRADDEVQINLVYEKGKNEWISWATIQSKLAKLISIHLVNAEKRNSIVKFIDGQEVLAAVRGKLSGVANISGLSSIPFSIDCAEIKDLNFTNPIQAQSIPEKRGLSAHLKLGSGLQFDLFNISTIDLHTSAEYWGLFYGERKDILPLILDNYEIDIPIIFIRRVDFNDHINDPLIVNAVYCPPGAQNNIVLNEKKMGYWLNELEIEGENSLGSWKLDINEFVGHDLLSMENFLLNQRYEEEKKEQRTIRGICITWDEKKWLVDEFIDIKLEVEIGKGKVDLPFDKIKTIDAAKPGYEKKKFEILLDNGEKIAGEGTILGSLKSVDKDNIAVKILAWDIKHLEIFNIE